MKTIFLTAFMACLLTEFSHASETVKGVKKDMAVFQQEMAIKLEALEVKLNELRAKAKVTGNQVQQKSIIEIEKSRDQLKIELAEAEKNSASKWKQMKKTLADSLNKLNTKVQTQLQD